METAKKVGWRSALTRRRVVIAGVVIGLLGLGWLSDARFLRKVSVKDLPFETPLPIQADHRTLAIGAGFSVGVKADGTVWTWGKDSKGRLGRLIGSQKEALMPGNVPEIEGAVAVAAGFSSAFAVTKSGEVWSWGDNGLQELGYETEKDHSSTPQKIPALENISLISFVGGTGLAVDVAGGVIMWGYNTSDARGENYLLNPRLKKINGLEKITAIEAGMGAYYAIDTDGRLWSFGYTKEKLGRQCAEEEIWIPGVVPLPARAVSVSANGDAHYALLEDGTVWSWGYRNGGQLGGAHRDGKWRMLPERIDGLSRIKLIASSSGGAAIDEDGRVFVWGVSAGGPPPPPPFARDDLWSPHALTAHAFAKPVLQLVDGMSTYALLDANGDVWYWKDNSDGQRGTGIKVDRPDKEYWLTPEKSAWNAN